MYILIKVLINVHLLVNELCEYSNTRCNDKKIFLVFLFCTERFKVCYIMLLTASSEISFVHLQELIICGFLHIIFMKICLKTINTTN
jgi:hypothetical protein